MNNKGTFNTHVEKGDTLVIAFHGRLDARTYTSIRNEYLTVLAENPYRKIRFDLSNLDFLDSTGLVIFIQTLKHSLENNKDFMYRHANDNIARVLKLVRLDNIIKNEVIIKPPVTSDASLEK